MRLNFFREFCASSQKLQLCNRSESHFTRKKWIRPYKGPFCVNNNHFVRINILLFFSITIFFRPLCVPPFGREKGRWKAFLPHRAGKMAQKPDGMEIPSGFYRPTDENMVCSALSCGLFFLAMEKMAHAKGAPSPVRHALILLLLIGGVLSKILRKPNAVVRLQKAVFPKRDVADIRKWVYFLMSRIGTDRPGS